MRAYLYIVWRLRFLYILFAYLYLTTSSLLFQNSTILYNYLCLYICGLI